MKLAETNYDNSKTGCCAELDVAQWDQREIEWKDKPFVKDHVRSFLYIPLNFGAVMTSANEAIEEAAAYPMDPITLSDEASPWGSDLYVAVEGDVPGAQVSRLSGSFLTRVFEGHYRQVGTWMKEMEEYAREKGHKVKKTYSYYATCPKCAKVFGKNYVVLLAQVG